MFKALFGLVGTAAEDDDAFEQDHVGAKASVIIRISDIGIGPVSRPSELLT